MKKVSFTYWRDAKFYIGFLNQYPDYQTQATTKSELTENLKDLLKDIESREVLFIRKVERMGIPQPKVSGMLRGDFSNLSERKLMDCLNRLGYDIELCRALPPWNPCLLSHLMAKALPGQVAEVSTRRSNPLQPRGHDGCTVRRGFARRKHSGQDVEEVRQRQQRCAAARQISPEFALHPLDLIREFRAAVDDIDDVLQVVAAEHILLPAVCESLEFCRNEHRRRDQTDDRALRQRERHGSFHCKRIPAVGKAKNALVRRHQIHDEITITPTADRRVLRQIAYKPQLREPLFHPVIALQRGDLGNEIDVVGQAHRCGGRIGNQQACGAPADKHQLVFQCPDRLRNQFDLREVRVRGIHLK